MKRGALPLLALIGLIGLCSDVWAWPYYATFIDIQESSHSGYDPGITAIINFGPIEDELERRTHCTCLYPYPCFMVAVDWQSPNDEHCWFRVFSAVIGPQMWPVDPPQNLFFEPPRPDAIITWGRGLTGCLDILKEPYQCWWAINRGYNRYYIETGPLISGMYRLRTICQHFPLYKYEYEACQDEKFVYTLTHWQPFVCDESYFRVKDQSKDFTEVTQLYYADSAGTTNIYGDEALNLLTKYWGICVFRTTRPEGSIPGSFVGEFYGEGNYYPVPKQFVRWPDGDRGVCDPEAIYKDYAYRTKQMIRPIDFWNLPPEEWHTISLKLDCRIGGLEPAPQYDTSVTEHVASLLYLRYLNDSTNCIIPTRGDTARFQFIYTDSLGLTQASDLSFNVKDNQDAVVYRFRFHIPGKGPGGEDPGTPPVQQAHVVPLFWNGRWNMIPNPGHCADPELGPYGAYVELNAGSEIMQSNVDTFWVVPKIDSVLITHNLKGNRNAFPPPGYGDSVYIYAIARGKIDDSGDTTADRRYYVPAGQDPSHLFYWDRLTYKFWDLQNRQYFEDDRILQIVQYLPWRSNEWGDLSYQWFVIRDYAERPRSDLPQNIYYRTIDTTQWWGNSWNPKIRNCVSWWQDTLFTGHMRLFVYSTIAVTKNGHVLSETQSASGINSHKVILGSVVEPLENWDIIDWAITHIGTPYFISDEHETRAKMPYLWLDCSGLVTATRIQDIGAINNANYRMDEICVNNYVDGYYVHNGDTVSTLTSRIGISTLRKGDCIALKNSNRPGYGHMALVQYAFYDRNAGRLQECYIIHARGDLNFEKRRVKADDFVRAYRNRQYRCLRFDAP